MSKFTRQLKAKYNVQTLIPATKPLLGLAVDSDAVIAVADAPNHLILADVDTEQQWALAKTSLSDIGIINIRKLKTILDDPSRSGDSLDFLYDVVSNVISLDLGGVLQSMVRSATDYCLVASYVQDGANKVIVLHVGPDKSSQCNRIVLRTSEEFGSRFQPHVPVSEKVAEKAHQFNYVERSRGVAGLVLCEALFGGENETDDIPEVPAESEPLVNPSEDRIQYCIACGYEIRSGFRFCPRCGSQQPRP